MKFYCIWVGTFREESFTKSWLFCCWWWGWWLPCCIFVKGHAIKFYWIWPCSFRDVLKAKKQEVGHFVVVDQSRLLYFSRKSPKEASQFVLKWAENCNSTCRQINTINTIWLIIEALNIDFFFHLPGSVIQLFMKILSSVVCCLVNSFLNSFSYLMLCLFIFFSFLWNGASCLQNSFWKWLWPRHRSITITWPFLLNNFGKRSDDQQMFTTTYLHQ